MAQVYLDTIRIVGRWRRITTLKYLHTTSKNFIDGLAVCMFQYGDYALILQEHATVYLQVAQTDSQTPTKHGLLGTWFRISVDLEINKLSF